MINLVPESDPNLKKVPSLWDFKNPLNIIRRLETEEVTDTPDVQDELKAPDLYNILVQHMVYYRGLGLAANQIGIPFKAFSMMVNDKDVICCFNPEIIKESDETIVIKEGCLSYPLLFLKIKRPKEIWVKYKNADGDEIDAHFEGLAARTFQHEMDHMNGTVFLDRVSKGSLRLARRKQRTLLKKERRNGRKS